MYKRHSLDYCDTEEIKTMIMFRQVLELNESCFFV